MVTHKRFQHYKRHYGSSLVTGLLGCRWHRYQQSKNDTGKVDLSWYGIFILVLVLITASLYYWIIAENSYDDLSWYLYVTLERWWPIYTIALALTCVAFIYMTFIFILTIFHLGLGYQLYIHWLHKVIFVLVLCGCITVWVITTDLWREGWSLLYVSFMITGPFVHISCVIVMTFLTWYIATGWLALEGKFTRAVWLSLYILVMVGLYIVPLFIHSPCICQPEEIPERPSLIAHRGAAMIAPENTRLAFELAAEFEHVWGFEADISISHDGVPFAMHDNKLTRTTDVKEKFPDLAEQCGCMFKLSELRQLSAGKWFFELDPHGTASKVSPEDRVQYENQTVPTLVEVLDIVHKYKKNLIFDLTTYEYGIPREHPYFYSYADVVIQTIVEHEIPQENIYWLYRDIFNTSTAHNFTTTFGKSNSTEELLSLNNIPVNLAFQVVTQDMATQFQSQNVSVNVWTVNTPWMYSIYWCMGVSSVTTDSVQSLSKLARPIWHLTPQEFRIMWLLMDVISLVLVVLIFIVQRLRKGVPKKFTPEVVTLNSAKRRITGHHHGGAAHGSRYMKEKLILAGEGLQEMELEQGIVGISDGGDNPDSSESTTMQRYSYSNSSGDFASINALEGISVHRLSGGISGLSTNLSVGGGMPLSLSTGERNNEKSLIGRSGSSSSNLALASTAAEKSDYGTMMGRHHPENSAGDNEHSKCVEGTLNISDIEVQVT